MSAEVALDCAFDPHARTLRIATAADRRVACIHVHVHHTVCRIQCASHSMYACTHVHKRHDSMSKSADTVCNFITLTILARSPTSPSIVLHVGILVEPRYLELRRLIDLFAAERADTS